MGLPYPAGAAMEELAFAGDLKYEKMISAEETAGRGKGRKKSKAPRRISDLPSPALREGLDFSFSGLKSALNNKRKTKAHITGIFATNQYWL